MTTLDSAVTALLLKGIRKPRGPNPVGRRRLYGLIDSYLADERARAGRFDGQAFASIGVARRVFGVIQCAIKYNSMVAVELGYSAEVVEAVRAYDVESEAVLFVQCGQSYRLLKVSLEYEPQRGAGAN